MKYLVPLAAGVAFAVPSYAQGAEDIYPHQLDVGPSATTDRLRQIYRVAGVYDNGSSGPTPSGTATTFACSSFSNADERIRFVIRNHSGLVVVDQQVTLSPRATQIASTHTTAMSSELVLGQLQKDLQGSAIIYSTTENLHCSAMIVEAASSTPSGIALHMVRVNPRLRTEE